MAKDAIMTMVERELRARPDIASSELHAKVSKKHAGARKLSTRQFHARYPLRVKKRWSLEQGGGKRRKASAKSSKSRATRRRMPSVRSRRAPEGTRELLVQFADELLDMRDPSFRQVLSRVDHYADLLGGR